MGFFDGIVGAVAGPLIGGLLGQEGQEDANAANAQISAENRQWQERMSNTAHQREVQDLIAAGLNPMLSAKLGGASTPTPNTPVMQNTKAELARGLSTVNATQVENTQAQTRLLEAQSAKAEAETAEVRERTGTYAPHIANVQASTEEILSRIPTYGASVQQMQAATREITERTNTYAPTIAEIQARTTGHIASAKVSDEQAKNLVATRTLIGEQVAETIAHTKESYVRQGLITVQTGLVALDQAFRSNEIGMQQYEQLVKQAQGIIAQRDMAGANKNKFDSDITWWGRNIRPYLRDFAGAASGAAAGAAAGRMAR